MGTVHGVYLKYVGLSALSYAGYSFLSTDPSSLGSGRTLLAEDEEASRSLVKMLPVVAMGYSTILNGAIAVLFKMEWGMGLIGKNKTTGQIPRWSYIVFFPFHLPTMLYTKIHSKISRTKVEDPSSGEKKYKRVPPATEVQPGWWVGGYNADELGPKEWGGIVDLTVEFPESCRNRTKHYLSAPTWDGVPLSPADLESAAIFAVEARKDGDVLVHCAHGRGRSTTVMCACLVKAGLFSDWEEAFEKGIKPYRT
eukprot:CAMPEP_0176014368 /NCGR_PEP_ID=MMETSP0120_2-20121206/6787_1 /TAXON_ID=160619 /ORGANISM="Kryptoperidinium foliaceum, Strain CCMP 1326" /LENGTH=252 /DNA_ID=CAMNT_0017347307 /DNA_START=116 /DNA_END=870 /DNA_ORIENTATION=-